MGVIVVLAAMAKYVPNTYGRCIRRLDTEASIRSALVIEFVLRLACILLVTKYVHEKKYFLAWCFAVFLVEHVFQEVWCYRQNKTQHLLTCLMEGLISILILIKCNGAFDILVGFVVLLVGVSHGITYWLL